MKNLKEIGLTELNTQEATTIEGGVPWWLYLVSPGGAYILDKFEEGCRCEFRGGEMVLYPKDK